MRSSDWSSDVCSSDLRRPHGGRSASTRERSAGRRADQQLQLVRHAVPLLRIGQGRLLVVNHRPLRRELGVDREEVLLAARDIVLWIDRAYRAFGHAQGAVDAAFRVDDEEIPDLVETVHRPHFEAAAWLAVYAVFGATVGT